MLFLHSHTRSSYKCSCRASFLFYSNRISSLLCYILLRMPLSFSLAQKYFCVDTANTFATVNINIPACMHTTASSWKRTEHSKQKNCYRFFVNFKPVHSLSLPLSLACSPIQSNPIHFSFLFANGLWMFASRASRTIHSIFKYANNFRAASVCTHFRLKCCHIMYMFCVNDGLIVKPCLPASAKLHKKQTHIIEFLLAFVYCCVCVSGAFALSFVLIVLLVLYAIDFMSRKHTQTESREQENEKKKEHIEHRKKQLNTKY